MDPGYLQRRAQTYLVGALVIYSRLWVVEAIGVHPFGRERAIMSDMWAALEQRKSPRGTKTAVLRNAQLLERTAATYFRMADFSASGRIDDDECCENLERVLVEDAGLEMPPLHQVRALLASMDRASPRVLTLSEFQQFVKVAVDRVSGGQPLVEDTDPRDRPAPSSRPSPAAQSPVTPATTVTPLAPPAKRNKFTASAKRSRHAFVLRHSAGRKIACVPE